MKKTLKLIILGLLVITFTACGKKENQDKGSEQNATASQEDIATQQNAIARVKYPGTWTNDVSSRMVMKVTSTGDNTYEIDIDWGQTSDDSIFWTMTATFNSASNKLEYNNCRYGYRFYLDNDEIKEEELYNNGTGELSMNSAGKIIWKSNMSDQDNLTEDMIFSKMAE